MSKTNLARLIPSFVLALLAVLSLLHVVEFVARPLLAPVDSRAEAVVSGIATRAAAAFAISKTIERGASFAEDVTIER